MSCLKFQNCGNSDLGSRIVDTGTIVKFHMELPKRANFEEILSLRISGINKGNIHIKRTFGVYSNSPKSFTFLSANGFNLDTSSKLITIEVPPKSYQVIKVPIKPLSLGRITIHARYIQFLKMNIEPLVNKHYGNGVFWRE